VIEIFKIIYFGGRQRLTHELISVILRVDKLVPETVEHVIALVHGVSQYVQLLEHSLVCDLPSHGLVDDDLCPEQDLVEAVIHILCLQYGAFADDEMYGSGCHLTEDSRKENLHLGALSSLQEDDARRWGEKNMVLK